MPPDTTEIDLQRSLFRFLTKAARKGERADRAAALSRLQLSDDSALAAIADGMYERLVSVYPQAPDLRLLLTQQLTPDAANALRAYDWVAAGIYVFGLPPTKTRSGSAESSAHRELKEWAAANGSALGVPADLPSRTEFWFPSGQEADVVFGEARELHIVEVRPRGAEPHELRQALFSLVAMGAVHEAQHRDSRDGSVASPILVLDEEPPPGIDSLASSLRVRLVVRAPAVDP